LVQPAIAELLRRCAPDIDEVLEVKSSSSELIGDLKGHHFSAAVTLQARFDISLALKLSGIPTRIGPYSKWFSFLFFNRGLRQKRSRAEKHEGEYNLDLAGELDHINHRVHASEPQLTCDPKSKEEALVYLKTLGIEPGFILIHPGMGGSALNWSPKHYSLLLEALNEKTPNIILAGSPRDKATLNEIIAATPFRPGQKPNIYIGKDTPGGLVDYSGLLSLASVVVAPSTGPLHIAQALGVNTVSFYPPVRVQSSKRWGPFSTDFKKHKIFTPDVVCPEKFFCRGKSCQFYYCMEKIEVSSVLAEVLKAYDSKS
jgi:ADP-heptose:LPS heptosyltransferase